MAAEKKKDISTCFKLPNNKTKIVCTLGPASSSDCVIKALMLKGMNVARLNFSHGTFEEHRNLIRTIRETASKLCIEVGIMIDLPGPKIRVGTFEDNTVHLLKGDEVFLTTNDVVGSKKTIPINYKKLPTKISSGDSIYLNDGFIHLQCLEVYGENIKCKVLTGGILSSNKGVNLPGIEIDLDPITEKDLEAIRFGLNEGVNIFSISFIEKAADIIKVRDFAHNLGKNVFLIAKIEREKAVKSIDKIIKVTDGLMIARGDMGVELPIQKVPHVQKELIIKATTKGIPIITATHMLESMIENIRPTRAEVTDIANAILDGTDAVMLSGETAAGKHPVPSVAMMASIAHECEIWREKSQWGIQRIENKICSVSMTVDEVISHHVNDAVQRLPVKYVITPTFSGKTARKVSSFKPRTWILAFSRNELTAESLTFSYGVLPYHVSNLENDWEDTVLKYMKKWNIYNSGDVVVLTKGPSTGKPGETNLLKIITLT
ncbi:pyruvate kinase [Methanosalsum natronophilum]|uniref:pyruvate kinase n=1 Tax=Methanosalsum natronophilum TaxID=768733 RepID=UPI0021691945|nr:pyruvate kinase [Methanosalsum natronophilum]MCS3924874.1 pyruvate kinase [Methanosalsum natronophilum]